MRFSIYVKGLLNYSICQLTCLPSVVCIYFMFTSSCTLNCLRLNKEFDLTCIVTLKDVIKVSLLQKGQNDRIKNIVSVFYGIQYSLNNFELSATIMTNSSPDHNISASTTVGLVHTLVRETFSTPAVNTITFIAKTEWKSGFIAKRMRYQLWSLQWRRARAQASLAIQWRCLRIGPTTGRLARGPDWHSLLRTVWSEIRTFTRPGVLRAVSSAVIIRFQRWRRRKCLSSRCEITRGLPLRCLSFLLPVCRRRIISLAMVILDTLKWSGTDWWVIRAWTIPTTRPWLFWRSRRIDVLVKIQIFRMAICLLLLTAQLITNSIMGRKIDFPEFFRNGTGCYCLLCEDKRVSRKHWRKWQ